MDNKVRNSKVCPKGILTFTLILLLTIQIMIPLNISGDPRQFQGNSTENNSRSVNISLSGKEKVHDSATTVIYGEDFLPVGGHLGHWFWTGDINGDGLNDLAIAAPFAPGSTGKERDGRVYIFYGNGDPLPPVIDLADADPDILIIGSCDRTLPLHDTRNNATGDLTNEMSAGDYNGDGYRDLVIAFPYSSWFASIYVIWGDESGLPEYIELNETMDSNTPPPHAKYFGLGQAYGGDDLKVPNYLMTTDIDNDGFDDIISGGYTGGDYLPVQGGVSIMKGSADGLTSAIRLEDKQGASNFGWALDIGDIDNDGNLDMIVGSPWRDNERRGLKNAGSVMVFFNISNFSGAHQDPLSHARCVINGSGANDEFGRNVELVDVDGDGCDDIIASAPKADGIMDFSSSCGQIYMFKGGPELSFPKDMDAESDFHTIVIGPEPYEVDGLEANPESLGEIMEAGDVDGDGKEEMAISSSLRNLEPGTNGERTGAGAVMLYEMEDLFPRSGGIVKLTHNVPFFTIEGEDIRDSLGFDLELEDADNDGIDDILIGAPGGDGPGNSRSASGEGYIIRGCGILIKDIKSSGKGISGRDLLAGGHPVHMNISFSNTKGSSMIDNSILHLDPDGLDIRFEIDEENIIILNDPLGLIDVDRATWGYQGEKGWLNTTISLSWFFPTGFLDISVEMLHSGIIESFRDFRDILYIRSAIEISEKVSISVSGDKQFHEGQWQRSKTPFSIEGLSVRYSSNTGIQVPDDSVELILMTEGEEVDKETYSISSRELEGSIGEGRYSNFSVSIRIIGDPPPGTNLPPMGDPLEITFNIDDTPPQSPSSVDLISSEVDLYGFSSSGDFQLEIHDNIGKERDWDGSGVREFQYRINDGNWRSIHSSGGLFGTYYSDSKFGNPVIERIDESISFLDWGYWSPDDMIIPPDHFSVRWHGWILPPSDNTLFRLRGHGQVLVSLDGDIIVNWGKLENSIEFGPLEESNDPLPIEIMYVHDELPGNREKAGIRLEFEDIDGNWQLVEDGLEHPSNSTNVTGDSDMFVSVRSVDWVGLHSDIREIEGRVDRSGPVIDTDSIDRWYSDPDPAIRIYVSDGDGAGLNVSSISMQLMEDGDQWSEPIPYTKTFDNGDGQFEFIFTHYLGDDWRGRIRFYATDKLDNIGRSESVELGIDRIPPEALLLTPERGKIITVGETKVIWRLTDGIGSGVVKDSIVMRLRSNITGDRWSEVDPYQINISGGYIHAEFKIGILTEEVVDIQILCRDNAGNDLLSSIESIQFEEPEVDLPPEVMIRSPENGSRFRDGEFIRFDATGTQDDGLGRFKELHLSWFSSRSGYLGSGYSIDSYLESGEHTITLYADDGTSGHNVSAFVTIFIEEAEDDPEIPQGDEPGDDEGNDVFIFMIVAFTMTTLIGSVMIYLLHKKRAEREDNTSLGIREMTEDDDEYEVDEYDF